MLTIEGNKISCSICHTYVDNTVEGSRWEPVAMQCSLEKLQHVFHRECIEKWRSVPQKTATACPVCLISPEQLIKTAQLRKAVEREVIADRTGWFRLARWRKELRERLFLPFRNRVGSSRRVKVAVFLVVVFGIIYLFFILVRSNNTSIDEEQLLVVKRVAEVSLPPLLKLTKGDVDEL